ncbi:MAG TPA: alpha/beta fold hydrolase, partial [Xanthobacteraceae bacterium]|nr:alpha/beta fold hydrolase [Xanthobacteraceae bacterium]
PGCASWPEARDAQSRKWLPYAETGTAQSHRLFCLPFAGGGASSFMGLRRNAPAWLDVQPVQLPGRESRTAEPPLRSVEDVVTALVEALRPWLDRPFALLGYSLGARIARALILRLRREDLPLPHILFLAAHRAPNAPSRRPPLHMLPSDAFWARLASYNGTPSEVLANQELRDLLEPMLRADFEMAEGAMPAATPLPCPVVAFAGTEDPFAGPQDMAGWALETRGDFELVTVEGAHFFLRTNARCFMDHVFSRAARRLLPQPVAA